MLQFVPVVGQTFLSANDHRASTDRNVCPTTFPALRLCAFAWVISLSVSTERHLRRFGDLGAIEFQ